MYPLRGHPQNYAWGKKGLSSLVAKFCVLSNGVNEELPYAELWFGDHPNGSSVISLGGGEETLFEHVSLHQEQVLGKTDMTGTLPFLFKILSINNALSLQAHPDKGLAARLHKEFPEVYRDANHKPELAIALTPMEALCQFRPLEEIAENLRSVPELLATLGEDICTSFITTISDPSRSEAEKKNALRFLFEGLITADKEKVKEQLLTLVTRLEGSKTPEDNVILRVHNDFPGDSGVFCIYLLNIIYLQPGQSIFIAQNEPHAYLKGDCMECMARSDNVVRAGLTPKHIDVPTLLNMLTYSTEPFSVNDGLLEQGPTWTTRTYAPPVSEFCVTAITVSPGGSISRYSAGPSVIVVVDGAGDIADEESGTGISLTWGSSVFLYAQRNFTLKSEAGITVYQATTGAI